MPATRLTVSLLYMIDNNIVYVILTYIDPATMSLVWNMKIVITALLFRFVLKRHFTRLRWIAGTRRLTLPIPLHSPTRWSPAA